MSATLRLSEVSLVPRETASNLASLGRWYIKIDNGSRSVRMELRDPSSTLSSKGLPGLGPEETIEWYFGDYSKKPFEMTLHDTAKNLLASYGRHLASQIAAGDLVPKDGHLQLQIVTPQRTEKSPDTLGPSLQHLHWEMLEDVSLWPRGFAFTKISVVRSLEDAQDADFELHHLPRLAMPRRRDTPSGNTAKPKTSPAANSLPRPTNNPFRILLVVCRPKPAEGVDYQLVAKSIVTVVDRISSTTQGDGTTALHILRPPTWEGFRDHLLHAPYHYDLVHFDTKGKIDTKDIPTASLQFCRRIQGKPLEMKAHWITADKVCDVLVEARVRNVVLNACDSASFRQSAPGTNLAELLLRKGIESVLGMAYKVNEEAVEIFMSIFYQSLLIDRASVEQATYRARLALLRNRSRRAPLMLRVELADHIVPVLYISDLSYDNHEVAEPEPEEHFLAAGARMATLAIARAMSAVRSVMGTELPRVLVGRDFDLLSLETHLSVSPKVLLYGQGGVGKSELLRYACRFWKSTGWIKGAAYIDFDQQRPCPHKSMAAIAASIASQLQFGAGEPSVGQIIKNLRTAKYLVVFDSAEVFDADNSMIYDNIRGNCSDDLKDGLPGFIDEVAEHGAMVVVVSRLDTTAIAPLQTLKYPLSGLSVASSVRLLQDIALKPGQQIPPALQCQRQIDQLQRVAILVEGNPVALRLLIPELRLANYDGEVLLAKLLYGVCDTLRSPRLSGESRLERSLTLTCQSETGYASKLAPFWSIMPKDLTMYEFFWETFGKFDLEPKHWLSESFCRQISSEPMLALMSNFVWPRIEQKLIRSGILGHATVSKTNGDMACYHVHPVFTLRSRALVSKQNWDRARFAFVRAARLWYSHDTSRPDPDWAQVAWERPGPQHEDHLYNWRAIAVGWCVQDCSAVADSVLDKQPLFHFIYQLGAGIVPVTPRYSRLLVPHLRSYLSELYAVVDDVVPSGQAPTHYVLSAILLYSHDLWKIETDVLNLPHAARAATLDTALAVLARWKACPSKRGLPLPLDVEFSHQQLLYASAVTAQEAGDIELAKARYEAHLNTNPASTISANTVVMHTIRHAQFCSLLGWAACITIIAMRSSAFPKLKGEEISKILDNLGIGMGKEAKPKERMERMAAEMRGLAGNQKFMGLRVRHQYAFAVESEPATVQRFGWVARALLDEPMLTLMAELSAGGGETGVAGSMNGEASALGQAQARLCLERALKLLPGAALDDTKGTKSTKGQQKTPQNPLTRLQASNLTQFDAMFRMFGDDLAGAQAVLQAELANESLSSTTRTGPEQLANLYMIMYACAVKEAAEPDYRKGLALLTECQKHRPMEQLAPRDQCSLLADFATCNHGLGRIEDAARAAIALVGVAQSLVPADCPRGDLEGAHRWIYATLFGFEKLHLFFAQSVVVSGSPRAPGLTFVERDRMRQIMTEAKRRWVERYKTHPEFKLMLEAMDLLVEMVQVPTI